MNIRPKFALILFVFLYSLKSFGQCSITINDTEQYFCGPEQPLLNQVVVNSGSATWYKTPVSPTPLNENTTFINHDDIYYADDAMDNCISSTGRIAVTIKFTTAAPDNVPVGMRFCDFDDPKVSDLQANGTNIKWYAESTTFNGVPDTSTILNLNDNLNPPEAGSTDPYSRSTSYYPTQVISGCESIASEASIISEVVLSNIEIDNNGNPEFCKKNNPTIAELSQTVYPIDNRNQDNIIPEIYENITGGFPLDDTTTLVDGETYYATITGNLCPVSDRKALTVSILDIPDPAVASENIFCKINNPTFEDIVVNGSTLKSDPSLILNFYEADGTTPITDNTSLLKTGDYFVEEIGVVGRNDNCPSEKMPFHVTIEEIPTAAINITSPIEFCTSDQATIQDDIIPLITITSDISTTTGTLIPKFYDDELKSNEITNLTSIIGTSATYYVELENDITGCISENLTRFDIIINLNSILTVDNEFPVFCAALSPTVDELSNYITLENELSTQPYLFYDAATSGNLITSSSLIEDGKEYWATINTNCPPVNRYKITPSLSTTPIPDIDNLLTFCTSDNADFNSIDLGTPNPATSPTLNILFYEGDGTTQITDLTLLLETKSYSARYTKTIANTEINTCPSELVTFNVLIEELEAPTVSASLPIEFCSSEMPSLKTHITPILIYNNPTNTIQPIYYQTETSTTPLDNTLIIETSSTFFVSTTNPNSGCISENRTEITVTIKNAPEVTLSATEITICDTELKTVSDLNVYSNADSETIWYNGLTTTLPLSSNDLLVSGTYYASLETNGCGSDVRTPLDVKINILDTITISNTTPEFCGNVGAKIEDLETLLSPTTDLNIFWYTNDTSTIAIDTATELSSGESYYFEYENKNNGCAQKNRSIINPLINDIQPPITPDSNRFCVDDNPVINDINISGTNIIWYDNLTGTNTINSSDLLVDKTTYYATQTKGNPVCESDRLAVFVEVTIPKEPLLNQEAIFCLEDNATLENIDLSILYPIWYQDSNTTNILPPSTVLVDEMTYYTREVLGTCVSNTTLAVTTTIHETASATIYNLPSFCYLNQNKIRDIYPYISLPQNIEIKWFSDELSNTEITEDEVLVNNKTYYFNSNNTATGCVNNNRVAVPIQISSPIPPTINSEDLELCGVDDPTISDLNNLFNYQTSMIGKWYYSEAGIDEIDSETLLEENTTYYLDTIDSSIGCNSKELIGYSITLTNCDPENYDYTIPNGFSPNGDGKNDIFSMGDIQYLYPDYEITIFNRYGKIVFEGNAENVWDGTSDQGDVPVGNYFYSILLNKNNKPPKQGTIYVNR